jgi:hypothetical protein
MSSLPTFIKENEGSNVCISPSPSLFVPTMVFSKIEKSGVTLICSKKRPFSSSSILSKLEVGKKVLLLEQRSDSCLPFVLLQHRLQHI